MLQAIHILLEVVHTLLQAIHTTLLLRDLSDQLLALCGEPADTARILVQLLIAVLQFALQAVQYLTELAFSPVGLLNLMVERAGSFLGSLPGSCHVAEFRATCGQHADVLFELNIASLHVVVEPAGWADERWGEEVTLLIRDVETVQAVVISVVVPSCLLYTSDAADE